MELDDLKVWVWLILLVVGAYYGWKWFQDRYSNNDWTLIVSSTETPNIDFVIKRLEGIKSKEDCYQLASQHTPRGGSWECARGDLSDKYGYGTGVWKEVCTANGCRE